MESTNGLLRLWDTKLNKDGDTLEIEIDQDLRNLSSDIIAKACFGSNYVEGREIFTKLRELQNVISKIFAGIPGYRYVFYSSFNIRTLLIAQNLCSTDISEKIYVCVSVHVQIHEQNDS